MFAFFIGIEDGKWKWRCLHCDAIFYTEFGRADTIPQVHQCPELEKEKKNERL